MFVTLTNSLKILTYLLIYLLIYLLTYNLIKCALFQSLMVSCECGAIKTFSGHGYSCTDKTCVSWCLGSGVDGRSVVGQDG